jgi:hypothetical protein
MLKEAIKDLNKVLKKTTYNQHTKNKSVDRTKNQQIQKYLKCMIMNLKG